MWYISCDFYLSFQRFWRIFYYPDPEGQNDTDRTGSRFLNVNIHCQHWKNRSKLISFPSENVHLLFRKFMDITLKQYQIRARHGSFRCCRTPKSIGFQSFLRNTVWNNYKKFVAKFTEKYIYYMWNIIFFNRGI